jgi:hypothetical protein
MTTSHIPARPRLLLVYNADGGLLNALKDALWKITSPATYPCSLCAITYGAVSMHPKWKRFLESLPLEVVFHHRDDFAAAYPGHGIALPAIAIAFGDAAPEVLVSKAVLDQTGGTMELIETVEEALVSEHLRRPVLKIVA